jgi:hypothetical protein
MKKTVALSLCAGVCFLISCSGGKPMDAATMQLKADSVFQAGMQVLTDSMNNDCSTNMSAWVQGKADSLFTAMTTSSK